MSRLACSYEDVLQEKYVGPDEALAAHSEVLKPLLEGFGRADRSFDRSFPDPSRHEVRIDRDSADSIDQLREELLQLRRIRARRELADPLA